MGRHPKPGEHEDPYFKTTGKVYFSEIQHAQYDVPPSYAVTEQQEPSLIVQQHEGPPYSVAEQQ